jgi:hypothetical protein
MWNITLMSSRSRVHQVNQTPPKRFAQKQSPLKECVAHWLSALASKMNEAKRSAEVLGCQKVSVSALEGSTRKSNGRQSRSENVGLSNPKIGENSMHKVVALWIKSYSTNNKLIFLKSLHRWEGWANDVCSSPLGVVVCFKGWVVSPLKRYVSWI